MGNGKRRKVRLSMSPSACRQTVLQCCVGLCLPLQINSTDPLAFSTVLTQPAYCEHTPTAYGLGNRAPFHKQLLLGWFNHGDMLMGIVTVTGRSYPNVIAVPIPTALCTWNTCEKEGAGPFPVVTPVQ